MIFSSTLRAADGSSAVSFLLLVQPALQTRLVDPFRAAFTPAGTHPLCTVVVSLGGKTHPAVSAQRNTQLLTAYETKSIQIRTETDRLRVALQRLALGFVSMTTTGWSGMIGCLKSNDNDVLLKSSKIFN